MSDAGSYFPPVPPPSPVLAPSSLDSTKSPMVREPQLQPISLPLSKISTNISLSLDKLSPLSPASPSTDGYGSSSSNTPATVASPPGLSQTVIEVIEGNHATIALNSGPMPNQDSAYSVAGLPALDVYIPQDELPDEIHVYDPSSLSSNTVDSAVPIRYVRVSPEVQGQVQYSAPFRPIDEHNPPRRIATLHLSADNLVAQGGNSAVFAAPIDMPGVAGRSRVVVKMPAPVCGAHYQIHHEARMYGAFPPDLMNTFVSRVPEHVRPILFEDYEANEKRRANVDGWRADAAAAAAEKQDSGKTKTKSKSAPIKKMWQALLKKASKRKAQPEAQKDGSARTKLTIEDLEKLELPPSVPKYYGYYIPVVDSEADDFNHNDCDAEGEHDVSHWPTPMLLMEDCGTPAVPSELKHVHKMFCTLLTILFHDAGFVHSAPTADKILVQPGPLTVPPSQRSFDDPSWRLIDFGCGDGLALRGDDRPFYNVEFRSAADADLECLWSSIGVDASRLPLLFRMGELSASENHETEEDESDSEESFDEYFGF